MSKELDKLCINAIRVLSADAIEKSKSGHPGLPLGAATMAYTLWSNMNHNGKNPKWDNRDRFVLSAGHGSMLEYSLLHLFGYGITVEDIKNFRQVGSLTPGHPEYGHTQGVEITTGPLGQGICNAVGMAIAEAHLAEKFNKPGYEVVNHNTYAIVGDGCLMEGISGEASSLAGTLGLGKLVVLYDSNNISIEGNTDIAFREDVAKRYEAYNWQVIKVNDGNDIEAIENALEEAKKETTKPSMIIVKNQIGFGCPAKQGKASAHGEPLGAENVKAMKENLGWKQEDFYVPAQVYSNMDKYINAGVEKENSWNNLFERYKNEYPELAEEYSKWMSGEIDSESLLNNEELWSFDKEMATRESSGIMINRLANLIPNLIGGSADLAPSNKTYMTGKGDFSAEDRSGRNLHFGVREHAMAAIANGMYAHGGLKVFCATFFVFSDYLKPAIRMSAIEKQPLIYVLTHDSIAVGEDGPTHEPIEQLAGLRAIPNVNVIRPADAHETNAAWQVALEDKETPSVLVLTRQNINVNAEFNCVDNVRKGAYIISEASQNPVAQIVATGSEVDLGIKAQKELENQGIFVDVVSMPCFRLFDMQDEVYKNSVLKTGIKKLGIEMSSSFGWSKYVDDVLCIDTFGASGNGNEVMNLFGFNKETVVNKVKELI